MATFRDSFSDAIRNALCSYLDTIEGWQSWFFEEDPIPITPPSLGLTRWAIRMLCNREPPPSTAPPFTGGQCLVNYSWSATRNTVRFSTGNNEPLNFNRSPVPGRIGAVQNIQTMDGQFPVWLSRIPSTDANGNVTYTDLGTVRRDIFAEPSWTNVVVTRLDGLPDDCGSAIPPITPVPPPYPPYEVPVNYDDDDGNSFSIPIVLVFAPVRIELNGNLTVPFRVTIDPTFNATFNGTINLNTGGININFNSPNYAPSPLPNPDNFDTPDDIPPYPPDVPNGIAPPSSQNPDDDTEQVIRACIVTVTEVDDFTSVIYQDANPDVYVPDLGLISFAIATKKGVAWTSDIRVKNRRQFIPCPWEGGALAVRGTPREGVTWTITRVYAGADKALTFA